MRQGPCISSTAAISRSQRTREQVRARPTSPIPRNPATVGRLAPLGIALLASLAHAQDRVAVVYETACAWCHGADGRGDGPAGAAALAAYGAPRPRDFTRGRFKLRSTPSGVLPTDADLLRTIERGIPGIMPSFQGLSDDARRLAARSSP
jgi:hypothetical protein